MSFCNLRLLVRDVARVDSVDSAIRSLSVKIWLFLWGLDAKRMSAG